jgi:hypothetical protein
VEEKVDAQMVEEEEVRHKPPNLLCIIREDIFREIEQSSWQ